VLEHCVRAGIPVEKIVHEACGRSAVSALTDPPEAGGRRRLAYFGQLARHKGVEVLLEAMKILQAEELDVELALHGANLGLQNKPFQQKIEDLLAETSASVRFTGQYEQRQLPALLAATDWVVMPSTWWEASPLVIQEALLYRRPVICAGIGGMAEMVTDGVNGLHFHPGAPARLADVIRRAVTSPELWRVLRDQIEDPRRMEDHLEVITSVYEDALDRRLAQAAAA
jgi:glycosyltransferase involved in cell wall biosynthesis